MRRNTLFHLAFSPLALMLLPSAALAQEPCTVDGHSYMALARASGIVGVDDYVNLVSVPTGGGADASTLVDTAALPIPLPLPVSAKLLSNSTSGDASACSADSFSSATDVVVDAFGLVTVTADLIEAATDVGPDGCDAGTKVVNLAVSVLGMPITIPDPIAPNTVIQLGPLGSVTLKEESCSESEASAAVVRVLLNVAVPLLASEQVEVVVSRANSVAFASVGQSPEPTSPSSSDSPSDPLSGLGLGSLLGDSSPLGGLDGGLGLLN